MFYEILMFLASVETSKNSKEIHLFAMLLSNWAVHCLTDSISCDIKLIIKLSFELTFWTQLELSYSYFQLNATQLDWKLNQLNSTRQELELDVKKVKYRKFSGF